MFFETAKWDTQEEKVLDLLKKRPRESREFPKFGILAYTKIISRLKKKGWAIETQQIIQKKKGSKWGMIFDEIHTTYQLH